MLKHLSNYHNKRLNTIMTSIKPNINSFGSEYKILYHIRKSIQCPNTAMDKYQEYIKKYYEIKEFPPRSNCLLIEANLNVLVPKISYYCNLNKFPQNRSYVQELQMILFYVANYIQSGANDNFIEFTHTVHYENKNIAFLIKRIMRTQPISEMLEVYHQYIEVCNNYLFVINLGKKSIKYIYSYPDNNYTRMLSDMLFHAANQYTHQNNEAFQVFVSDLKLSDVGYYIDNSNRTISISDRMKLYTKFHTIYNGLSEINKQTNIILNSVDE